MAFQIGDIVNSNWDWYSNVSFIVDRVYTRRNGTKDEKVYLRLVSGNLKVNVPESSCKYDKKHFRSSKIESIINPKN